jgi:DNA-binding transcriptional MocR family regulator
MGTIWSPDLAQFEGPKYRMVLSALEQDIENDVLAKGEKLPPVRELAWEIGVTPGTIARAYQEGVSQGLLEAQVGRGTFVATQSFARASQTTPYETVYAGFTRDGKVNLRNTNTTDVGQAVELRRAMIHVANNHVSDYVNYPGAEGRHAIYPYLADWMSYVGVNAKPEQILMTHGGQSAITVATQTILRNSSGKFAIEALTYPGIRYAVEGQGGQLVGIEIDEFGMVPSVLEKQCKKGGIKAIFLSANVLNPTTGKMPTSRRQEIADIARRYDVQIVEDDCWAVGPSDTPSFQMLCPERAWYISSFSKVVSAGLRFGYLVCPESYVAGAKRILRGTSFGVSRAVSDTAHHMLETGDAQNVRARIAERVAERVSETVNMLGQWDITYRFDVPYIWLRLPKGWRASRFATACEREMVLVRPSDEFTIEGMPVPHAVRISVNCNLDDKMLREALEKVNTILANPPMDTEA